MVSKRLRETIAGNLSLIATSGAEQLQKMDATETEPLISLDSSVSTEGKPVTSEQFPQTHNANPKPSETSSEPAHSTIGDSGYITRTEDSGAGNPTNVAPHGNESVEAKNDGVNGSLADHASTIERGSTGYMEYLEKRLEAVEMLLRVRGDSG